MNLDITFRNPEQETHYFSRARDISNFKGAKSMGRKPFGVPFLDAINGFNSLRKEDISEPTSE